jgi:hypothetical protein
MKSAIEKIEDVHVKAHHEEEDPVEAAGVAVEVEEEDDEPVVEAVPAPKIQAKAAAGGFVWQQVGTNKGAMLRGKVAGGWLVKVDGGVCFYPDAGHKWDGGTLD